MKVFKWLVLFAIAFLTAWILIFTFNQDPFKAKVPAQVLLYKTPPVAIYIYLTGAFLVGLLVGLWVAIYNYVTLKSKLSRATKKLSSTEHELSQATVDLENCRAELASIREKELSQASPQVKEHGDVQQ